VRSIRDLTAADRPRLAELLRASWGSTRMASRGRLLEITELPGFVAIEGGDWLGYGAYEVIVESLEVAVLESLRQGTGVGGGLLAACVAVALESDLRRLWLITTNDNTTALSFYQRHGFRIVVVHRDAVTRARHDLKPEIALTGLNGTPIRDEIELELPRAEWADFVRRYRWPS
jgi:N-acetylglutamate synthase-like GNAT family acetyltransferase